MKPRDARPTKPVAGNAAARDLVCTIGQVCVNLTGLSTPKWPAGDCGVGGDGSAIRSIPGQPLRCELVFQLAREILHPGRSLLCVRGPRDRRAQVA